jgi:hypothetical protein
MYEDSYLPYGAVPFPGYEMEDMAEFGAVPFPGYEMEDYAEYGAARATGRNIAKLRKRITQAQAALKVANTAGRKRRLNRRIARWKKQLKTIRGKIKERAGKGRDTRRFRKAQAAMKRDKFTQAARKAAKKAQGGKISKAMNKKAIAIYTQLRRGAVPASRAFGQAVTQAYPPPYRREGNLFLRRWAARNEGRFTMKQFGQQRFVPPARPRYQPAQTAPLPQRPRFRADMYNYEPDGAFQTVPSMVPSMEDYSPPMEEEITDLAPMEDEGIEEFEDEEFAFEEEKPFWQQPAFLIGAVVVAGGAYYLTAGKKPKRKTTVKAKAKKGGKAQATIRANRRRRNTRRRTTRRRATRRSR